MRLRFWGTRGSLPKPGASTMRYGGNTPCVEVRTADGHLVVLDCGTGAQGLGQALLASAEGPVRGHVLLTHMHWDHIQGLPFFAPLFAPGNEWDIYGPGSPGQPLQELLEGQMAYPYFPIALQQFGATIRYHTLGERPFQIGNLRITPRYLNHPALTLGYRLDTDSVTVVYATDHEPHLPYQPGVHHALQQPWPGWLTHREEQGHRAFLAEADLVIHDAQYSLAEYQQRLGWGHSPVEYAVDIASAAQARQLALFHHEPWHDDEAIAGLVDTCRQRVVATAGSLHVFAAAEGQVIDLPEPPGGALSDTVARASLGQPGVLPTMARTVLLVDDEPHTVRLITDALHPEGVRVLAAADGEAALRLARAESPALILLHWHRSDGNGIEVCRALRADTDAQLHRVPMVLLSSQTDGAHIAAGFAAGVTDYLLIPCKPTYVRARVCGWLLRTCLEAATGLDSTP